MGDNETVYGLVRKEEREEVGPLFNHLVARTQGPSGGESGGEYDDWLDPGDHPLFNDVILKILFRTVRRFDLKSCRAVCQQWNLHTIPHMRATFPVTIYLNKPNTTKYLHTIPHMRATFNSSIYVNKPNTTKYLHTIDDFVKLFSSNKDGIPFGKFKLGRFCTTHGVGQQFLQLCGKIATEIDLYQDLEAYKVEDVSELLRQCPNLKFLGFPYPLASDSGNVVKLFPRSIPTFTFLKKITFHRGNGVPLPWEPCPSSIQELLTAAPNISNIVVSDIPKGYVLKDEDKDLGQISVVLNCIEELGRESTIQSLHLHNARIQHIEHLRKLNDKKPNGLKLKNLTFKKHPLSQENFDTAPIQLARIFRDTLQSLNVDLVLVTSENKNILMVFPFMRQLKSLAFKLYPGSAPQPVNLTRNFPVLAKLDIEFGTEWEGLDLFPRFEYSPTIKSLTVQSHNMQLRTLRHILRVFPNLTNLNFLVKNDTQKILREIWSQMTELESLSISIEFGRTEEVDMDSLFTGIPTETIKRIRHVVNGFGFHIMTVQQKLETILRQTERHSRLPSIRNLTKLRHLELNVAGRVNSRTTHLSDVTAFLAFYSMKHLNHLIVKGCMFTKTCCEILTEETGIENWSFLTRDHTTFYQQNIIPPFLTQEGVNHKN